MVAWFPQRSTTRYGSSFKACCQLVARWLLSQYFTSNLNVILLGISSHICIVLRLLLHFTILILDFQVWLMDLLKFRNLASQWLPEQQLRRTHSSCRVWSRAISHAIKCSRLSATAALLRQQRSTLLPHPTIGPWPEGSRPPMLTNSSAMNFRAICSRVSSRSSVFTLYTTPLNSLISGHFILHHLYADDSQLYVSFSLSDSAAALNGLQPCLASVQSWMLMNKLKVNPDKTEFLLIGNER